MPSKPKRKSTYWASKTKEERSAMMRELILKKHKSTSFKQKHDLAMKMVAARVNKTLAKDIQVKNEKPWLI